VKTPAQVQAWLDSLDGIAPPKPKAVVVEDQIVRDAEPHVSRTDPNYPNSEDGVVKVRRPPPGFVTINMQLYEQQRELKALDRRRMREIDPFGLGLWGPVDEDD
jgi:hypothetical protein